MRESNDREKRDAERTRKKKFKKTMFRRRPNMGSCYGPDELSPFSEKEMGQNGERSPRRTVWIMNESGCENREKGCEELAASGKSTYKVQYAGLAAGVQRKKRRRDMGV